ncbi:NfeD family protein [Thermococcus sp.]
MKASEPLKLLALAADEIIVGLFLLVVLPAAGIDIPLPMTAAIILALLIKDFLIAPFVLRGGLSARPKTGPESLIGKEALVIEELSPEGVVKVEGEMWKAECLNGNAERGESVTIVGLKGAKLLVERRG